MMSRWLGRLRKNIAFDNALEFFVVGDQLLRGAALNAVVVAEAMVENGALKAKAVVYYLSLPTDLVNNNSDLSFGTRFCIKKKKGGIKME